MGNTCHCVNKEDNKIETNLAATKNDHRTKQKANNARDDESEVGDEGFEQEFDANDPDMQNAALKI